MGIVRFAIVPRGLGALIAGLLIALLLVAQAQAANPRYASITVDVGSGEVLDAQNADKPRFPASLTKMMTLYLLFEALEDEKLSFNQMLPVSSHAAAQPPSKLWVRPGDRVSIKEAILALVVRSANDVAVVVAEGLAGTEHAFAKRMTAKARELGMKSTVFRNASGLPDDAQVTTAKDMATLSLHLMKDFPQYYGYFSRTEFVYRGKTHTGHNNLLDSYAGADGLKTGYIRASGFNIATSATRHHQRVLTVVMGGFTSRSRDAHTADLLDRGFARLDMQTHGDWLAQAAMFDDFRLSMPSEPPRQQRPGMLAHAESGSVDQNAKRSPKAQASLNAASSRDPIRRLIDRDTEVAANAWGVQVGAFHDRSGAQNLAARAASQLDVASSGAQVSVQPAQGDTGVFRARIIDMDEQQARRSCRELLQKGTECVVVKPEVAEL